MNHRSDLSEALGRPHFGAGPWLAGPPSALYQRAGRLLPWLSWAAVLLCALGVGAALWLAPLDARHGESHRILFIHVPAAWLSLVLYALMAFWAALSLRSAQRIAAMLTTAVAPTGAMMTFLTLATGALWGKPIWGAWWVWDARLATELILLALFLAVMAVHTALESSAAADRLTAWIALAGLINLPLVYVSVHFWSVSHQRAVSNLAPMAASSATLLALSLMTLGLWAYSILATLVRLRAIILEAERDADWVAPSRAAGL